MTEIESKDMNYKFVLMRHLDRMSAVTSMFVTDPHGNQGIDHGRAHEHKVDSFDWSVMFLMNLIPEELKDREYREKQEEISELKEKRIVYLSSCFYNCINLLSRKGILLSEGGMMNLAKPREGDEGEVWDD